MDRQRTKNNIPEQKVAFEHILPHQTLQFPMQVKLMTDEETKEYHLKKFFQWGNKCEHERKGELAFGVDRKVYRNGKLLAEEPTDEQKEWVIGKMKAPAQAWQRWFVGLYFAEEQKHKMVSIVKDISGKGMAK